MSKDSSNIKQQGTDDSRTNYHLFTHWRSDKLVAPPEEQRIDTQVKNAFGSRKSNATLIGSANGPPLGKRMQKLSKHNRDIETDYRFDVDLSSRADYEMKVQVMRTLGTQLDVGWYLILKGTRQLLSTDVSELGLPMGAIGFCLYVTLYDEATTAYENRTQRMVWESSPGNGQIYWPFREKEANHDSFQRIADSLIEFYPNITERSLQSVLQKLIQGGLPKYTNAGLPLTEELLPG